MYSRKKRQLVPPRFTRVGFFRGLGMYMVGTDLRTKNLTISEEMHIMLPSTQSEMLESVQMRTNGPSQKRERPYPQATKPNLGAGSESWEM